ncbi:MAG: hypothetical protein AAF548_15280 [Actinomycetota bacterium]
MDLLDILRVVRKRWKSALVAGIAGFALLFAASSSIEPDWDGTAIVWIAPPNSEVTITDIGEIVREEFNPVTNVGAASEIVPLLAVTSTSQETRTTFAQAGLSTAYEVSYVQRQPYITIDVTDGDPDRVLSTIDAVVQNLELTVRTLQDESDISESSRASVRTIAETEIAANNSSERRAQGVLFVLTVAGAVAAAMLTDLYFRRRDEAAHLRKYGPGEAAADESAPVADGDGDDGLDERPAEKPNRWQRRGATPS